MSLSLGSWDNPFGATCRRPWTGWDACVFLTRQGWTNVFFSPRWEMNRPRWYVQTLSSRYVQNLKSLHCFSFSGDHPKSLITSKPGSMLFMLRAHQESRSRRHHLGDCGRVAGDRIVLFYLVTVLEGFWRWFVWRNIKHDYEPHNHEFMGQLRHSFAFLGELVPSWEVTSKPILIQLIEQKQRTCRIIQWENLFQQWGACCLKNAGNNFKKMTFSNLLNIPAFLKVCRLFWHVWHQIEKTSSRFQALFKDAQWQGALLGVSTLNVRGLENFKLLWFSCSGLS